VTQTGQTRKQEQAIAALLTETTIEAAATVCGVSLRTLKRWLADDGFQREYRAARRHLVERATGRLREAMGRAVKVLDEVAADKEAASAARVTAASRIIELGLRSHEVEDLQERLERLEREMEKGE
jgi:hypothetical protein